MNLSRVTNLQVKDENCDLLADFLILNRCKIYLSQLLNVSDVRQIEMHTAEPLVPDPEVEIAFEVEIVVAKLKKYKSPGSDQISAELIQAGGEILQCEIHKLSNSIWSKQELLDQWNECIIIPVYKRGDKIDCSNYQGVSVLSTSYKILSNGLLSRLSPYIEKIIGDRQYGFQHNNHCSESLHSSGTGKKRGRTMRQYTSYS
jgi:hypothetical protein